MTDDERQLCVMCIGRGVCQSKYSMPGGMALHCREYERDVALQESEPERRKRNVLIIGPAGTERTRLIETILARVGLVGLRPDGYYTKVVKDGLFRSHAELVVLSDEVRSMEPAANPETVSRQLASRLEQALQSEQTRLLVLDEVGALPCASAQFRRLLVDCFTSDKSVLATMSLGGRDHPFLLSLESRSDVTVLPMSDERRDCVVDVVASLLAGELTEQPEPV